MAKGMGTKGGALKQKEQAREDKARLNKSADSLASVDENLKGLSKGIKELNSNVATIKIIEGAQLANDIRSWSKADKTAQEQSKQYKQGDARAEEMSARNEAGLHDISKGISALHSLLAGESDSEARDRYATVKSDRKNSLKKHRKVLAAQREFLEEKGADKITDLSSSDRAEWDKTVGDISRKHGVNRPTQSFEKGAFVKNRPDGTPVHSPGVGSVQWPTAGGMGGGTGGGSGGGSGGGINWETGKGKDVYNWIGQTKENSDAQVWKLTSILTLLKGNRLLDKERRRETKKPGKKFGKTSKVTASAAAIAGLGAGTIIGSLFEAGAMVKAFKFIKAKVGLGPKKVATPPKAEVKPDPKTKAETKTTKTEAKTTKTDTKKSANTKALEKRQKAKLDVFDKIDKLAKKYGPGTRTKIAKRVIAAFATAFAKVGGPFKANPIIALGAAIISGAVSFTTVHRLLYDLEKELESEAKMKAKLVADAAKRKVTGTIIPKDSSYFEEILGTEGKVVTQDRLDNFAGKYNNIKEPMKKDWHTNSDGTYNDAYYVMQKELKAMLVDWNEARGIKSDPALSGVNTINSGNTSTNITNVYGNPGQ